MRQKGLTSCLVQALQLVKITHICSRSKGVLAALWDVRRDTARPASRVQPDEYKPDRVRPFVMIREIHTVILPLLVCAITSIDL